MTKYHTLFPSLFLLLFLFFKTVLPSNNHLLLPCNFRISADLNTNTKPLKNFGIISNGILEFQNRKSITENLEIPLIRDKETEKTVFSRFCKTLKMIEDERLYMRERLKVSEATRFSLCTVLYFTYFISLDYSSPLLFLFLTFD